VIQTEFEGRSFPRSAECRKYCATACIKFSILRTPVYASNSTKGLPIPDFEYVITYKINKKCATSSIQLHETDRHCSINRQIFRYSNSFANETFSQSL